MFILSGAVSAVIGFTAISNPATTAEALLLLKAVWLVSVGIGQFCLAYLMSGDAESSYSRWSGLVGILYVVTGVSLISNLGDNVEFFIQCVGLCLVSFGMQMIYFGMNLKRLYVDVVALLKERRSKELD
ncbi:protein of unknown function DUF308 containing protein [Nitzschia inconspicua]|uniref:Uncharacterized protein n=1 Tax=Nitzschia inconspicua TaxID=303405 RepID=A0A9K3PNR7_9STRA|nr:protein of unknown function DUF308 containing protein [Nitzschia inconspicua]